MSAQFPADERSRRFAGTAALCVSVLLVLGAGAGLAAAPPACTIERADSTTIEADDFIAHGYGARWNAATGVIAYMQPDAQGYYRVWTVRPDGSGTRLVSGPDTGLPQKHQGAPYWHPSGGFLLLTAQKSAWSGRRLFGIPDYEALPGFGRHDDLWLLRADGTQAWQLTHEPNTRDAGVLVPVFSRDGVRVAWSARLPGGKYALKVADFSAGPEPHLDNVRTYQPGGAAYYETGSFTSDGGALFYTSDQDTHSFWHSQIYRLDLASGTAVRVTSGNDYNEHPTVVGTAAGDWVIYMSTRGVERFPGHILLGTDWWAMRADGSAGKRLTRMNVRAPDNPQNSGQMQVACTVAMSPDGTWFLGDVQDSLVRQSGRVRRVRFSCAP